MVAAWPRIMSPRSAWFFSICWRSSGVASKTTPLPKIGVMNGYAAAWSRVLSGARKNCSLASAPDTITTSRSASRKLPMSPHSSRTRCSRPIGSVRSSSRWPCGSSGFSRDTSVIVNRSSTGASGVTSTRFRCTPRGALTTAAMALAIADGLEEVRVPGEPEPHPLVEHVGRVLVVPGAAHLAPRRAGPDDAGAYAGALELHLHRLGEPLEAPLAGGVRRHERPRPHRHVGGDEHQVAASPLHHARHERAHQPMGAEQVHVELGAHPFGVDLVDDARADGAGVGDDHLDVAEVRCHRLGEVGDGLVVGQVQGVYDGLAAGLPDLRRHLVALLGATRAERDREALRAEHERRGRTDARRGARDDGGPTRRLGVLAHRASTRTGRCANPRTFAE